MSILDCKRIIKGNDEEISRAQQTMQRFPKLAISSQAYINLSENCKNFKSTEDISSDLCVAGNIR